MQRRTGGSHRRVTCTAIQANMDIQPTFAQMRNVISELMQANEQLRREVTELQASQ